MLKFSTKSVQTLTKRHHFISLKTNLFNIIELKKKSQPLVKSFVIYSLCIPGITNIIWAVETNIVYLSQYGTMVTVVIQRCVDHMVSQHHIPTLPGQKRNIAYKHFKVSHQIHFNAHSPRVWLFSKSILFYIPTHNTPSNFSEFGQWPPPPLSWMHWSFFRCGNYSWREGNLDKILNFFTVYLWYTLKELW